MKLRILAATTISLAALAAAGCGGSSGKVASGDIAVVCGQHVTQGDWVGILRQQKAQAGGKLPKVGTTQYESMKQSLVKVLVQNAAYRYKAEQMGLKATSKEIGDEEQQIITGQYHGKRADFLKALLPKFGLTYPEARKVIAADVLQKKIQAKILAGVKVSDADIKAYFEQNKAQYATPEQRSVAHILVKTKAEADKLEQQLKNGADFATLARKHSLDKGSKAAGGQLMAVKGQLVQSFQDAAFALKTGKISQPVQSTYGWHIIKALGPIQPAKSADFATVKESIRTTLQNKRQPAAVSKFVKGVQKQCIDKAKYAAGYAPPTQTTPATPGVTKT
jgi:parvulin-like peptidyl-prolyl isomerase